MKDCKHLYYKIGSELWTCSKCGSKAPFVNMKNISVEEFNKMHPSKELECKIAGINELVDK